MDNAAKALVPIAATGGDKQMTGKITIRHWRRSASLFDLSKDGICLLAFTDDTGRYGYICIDQTQLFKPDGRFVTVTLDQGNSALQERVWVGDTSKLELANRFRAHLRRVQIRAGLKALQEHLDIRSICKQLDMFKRDIDGREHVSFPDCLSDALVWARATVEDLDSLLRMLACACEETSTRHWIDKLGVDDVFRRLENVRSAFLTLHSAFTEYSRWNTGAIAVVTSAKIWMIRVRDIDCRLGGAIAAMGKVKDSLAGY